MQAILWDFDGTIADTTQQHYESWRICFLDYGIQHTFADFMRGFGRINSQIIPMFLPNLPKNEIAAFSRRKEALFREILAQTPDFKPLPGVLEWMVHFHEAHIAQVMASSGPMANLVAGVRALHLEDFFHAILSGYYLPEGKPHPAIFLNAAASLQMKPEQCLVMEDSPAGVEAAMRAGMACVVVGDLAHDGRLDSVLAKAKGGPCLPVGNLEELTWEMLKVCQ
ncbi:MAG: HAD family phosphatase [Caldilineaceae bacterium]